MIIESTMQSYDYFLILQNINNQADRFYFAKHEIYRPDMVCGSALRRLIQGNGAVEQSGDVDAG